ncbi:MAG: endonuclease/exonuclease/phosphatase family protein [Cellulophaga sp.]
MFKFILVFTLLYSSYSNSQNSKNYRIRTIAFYNVENLFDIENDSTTFDDDRTPLGKDNWTLERYVQKVANISTVLSQIGHDVTKSSPDIIGLCEIENKSVLEDIIQHPELVAKNYGIVHYDSPDERGIDVALLYKKTTFTPTSFKSHRLLLFNNEGFRDYTRDQLVVGGLLEEEEFYFIINHWPSRSGGEARSRPNRIAAAKLSKRIIDSLSLLNPIAKIISMGDFNDDPINDSLKKILKTVGEKENLADGTLFNPMHLLFKKGVGSLAYRDQWFLFDQVIFSKNLAQTKDSSFRYWKAGIFNPSYLITQEGKYKGYPFRTYSGGNYTAGYSDHFPVYVYLIKPIE